MVRMAPPLGLYCETGRAYLPYPFLASEDFHTQGGMGTSTAGGASDERVSSLLVDLANEQQGMKKNMGISLNSLMSKQIACII